MDEGVGVDGGDERAAVDVAGDRAGLLDLGDRVDAADHGRGGLGQLGRAGRRGSGRFGRRAGWCRGRRSRSRGRPRRRRRVPSTATMAATPMAMPSAESPARSLRVRSPTVDRRARSEGRSFFTSRVAVAVMADVHGHSGCTSICAVVAERSSGAVEDDLAVEHLDPSVHARRDVVVVGDDHDGHPELVQLFEEPQDGLPGRLIEVAGRLVGEHDGRAADQGPGDRHALALAARELVGAGVGSLVEADQVEGVEGPGPPFDLGDAGVEEAVGHVVQARSGARPGRTAGTRSRSASPAARPARRSESRSTSRPVIRTRARAGPVQGAHQVQQGGLARPRRSHDAHQLAPGDGEGHVPQGGHRRLARVRPWSPCRLRAPAGRHRSTSRTRRRVRAGRTVGDRWS